ncbi:unnamed protein product [Lupinus luteus]|uniref:Uncharacterized protein n=1 Tax=Lupinus luteus TaxID=3873 RepID=A0AAV1XQE8_LUPLU
MESLMMEKDSPQAFAENVTFHSFKNDKEHIQLIYMDEDLSWKFVGGFVNEGQLFFEKIGRYLHHYDVAINPKHDFFIHGDGRHTEIHTTIMSSKLLLRANDQSRVAWLVCRDSCQLLAKRNRPVGQGEYGSDVKWVESPTMGNMVYALGDFVYGDLPVKGSIACM